VPMSRTGVFAGLTEQLPLDLTGATSAPTPEPTSFHIRSHTSVAEAEAGEKQAKNQERAILEWFRMQDACAPGVRFRPSQVHAHFGQWPITSIRRALSNLTYANPAKLTHWPGDRGEGPLGAKESTWSLSIFHDEDLHR
jgi:hypothetical protein